VLPATVARGRFAMAKYKRKATRLMYSMMVDSTRRSSEEAWMEESVLRASEKAKASALLPWMVERRGYKTATRSQKIQDVGGTPRQRLQASDWSAGPAEIADDKDRVDEKVGHHGPRGSDNCQLCG
jgi:hypothetical protein